MRDDKSKRGAEDRSKVSGSEDYEVEQFAKANEITTTQTLQLIREHGNNRAKLEVAAAKLKAKQE